MMLIHVASPPFNCGASLLVNVFLELGYRVRYEDLDYWRESPGSRDDTRNMASYDLSEQGRQHFNILSPWYSKNVRNSYEFDDAITLQLDHRLNILNDHPDAIIYVVRDPIDAIYSWHRRVSTDMNLQFNETEFQKYWTRSMFNNSFPCELYLPPPMLFSVHAELFRRVPSCPVHVIRFEDMKGNSVNFIGRLLRTLGSARTDAEIHDAVAKSEPSTLSSRKELNGTPSRAGGTVAEWSSRISSERHHQTLLACPFADVFQALGYLPSDIATKRESRSLPPAQLLNDVMLDNLGPPGQYVRLIGGSSVDHESLDEMQKALACSLVADAIIHPRGERWKRVYQVLAEMVWSSWCDPAIQRLVGYSRNAISLERQLMLYTRGIYDASNKRRL